MMCSISAHVYVFQMFDKYVSSDDGLTLKNKLVMEPYKQVWQFVSNAATV